MEETLIGRASRERLSPGNLREPGLCWEIVREALGNTDCKLGERELQTLHFFHLSLISNAFQGARGLPNDEIIRGNKLAPA